MEIKRLLTNVCSDNLERSKSFYTSLFLFEVGFDSDWFINLVSTVGKHEIGIISTAHEMVPEEVRGQISGVYLTFVVEDVQHIFTKAQELNYKIIQAPQVTSYGQRRMLLQAPEGTVCDVSSPS